MHGQQTRVLGRGRQGEMGGVEEARGYVEGGRNEQLRRGT